MYGILILEGDGMKIYQAYYFRMYPIEEQQIRLNQFLGTSRFIYNHYLSVKERTYKEEGKNLSLSELKKDLVPLQQEYPWLKEADRYYVSVCVEKEIPEVSFEGRNIVGIDLGVKDLVITSDGIKYKALENIKKYERKIKGYNKMLSRSKKRSNNREKIKKKLERVYQKMRNARKYYTHFITSQIVKENDIIVCEKLKVQEMIKKGTRSLSRMIANSSLSEIVRQLRYKTEWSNKRLYQVDTYYPSSQICNHCGAKNEEVKDLSIRKYECKKCGSLLDRDINASINILTEGIKYYIREIEQN